MTGIAAGFGLADITPRMPTPLSGFASRTGLATDTLDPLTARALLLAEGELQVALVALDLIGVPDGLAEAIRAFGGTTTPQLILTATHTHAGPPVLARAMLGKPSPEYLEALANNVLLAIHAAQQDLRPARIIRRSAVTDGIAHNRRDAEGPVDHSVDVVDCAREGSAGIVWINFACHPVVLGPDNLAYSADFPGAAREHIADATGAHVIYTTGCAGEINLGHSALDSIRKIGLDKRTPKETQRIGKLVADAVKEALGNAGTLEPRQPLEMKSAQVAPRFEIPDEAARAAIRDAATLRRNDQSLSAGERMMAEIDLAWFAAPAAQMPELPVSALRFGPVEALFLPGEIFVETALAIKARRPGAMVIGYAGLNPGYIPPATASGGYEAEIAWRPYGAPGPFTPGMAEALAEAALAL